jgi:uncharacterized phage-associated protein
MEKPFKSIAVANRFIDLAKKSDSKLTLMKLLKIVYFAHGWHLALRDKSPLIDDTIEAWKFGPVAPCIYHSFKEYGSSPITDFGKEIDVEKMIFVQPVLEGDSFLDGFMNKIWEVYGSMTAFQLSELTHQVGTPWHKVWFELGGSERKGVDIPDVLIADYFAKRLTPQEAAPIQTQPAAVA